MRYCEKQYNRSISPHVEKLIYVNIYPQKCFHSVTSLKARSWADEKLFSSNSLYLKGVTSGGIVWSLELKGFGFFFARTSER